jgi:hypothetical protein
LRFRKRKAPSAPVTVERVPNSLVIVALTPGSSAPDLVLGDAVHVAGGDLGHGHARKGEDQPDRQGQDSLGHF